MLQPGFALQMWQVEQLPWQPWPHPVHAPGGGTGGQGGGGPDGHSLPHASTQAWNFAGGVVGQPSMHACSDPPGQGGGCARGARGDARVTVSVSTTSASVVIDCAAMRDLRCAALGRAADGGGATSRLLTQAALSHSSRGVATGAEACEGCSGGRGFGRLTRMVDAAEQVNPLRRQRAHDRCFH